MRKKKITLFSVSVILLLLGLLLYLLLNREVYVSKMLLRVIPIWSINKETVIVKILKGYGADMLWSASFTMIIQFIVWFPKKKLALLLFCSLLGIAYEIIQYYGFTTGVSDIRDVIVYIFGSLLAIQFIAGGKFYEEENSGSSNGN